MICKKCGAKVTKGSKFCPECGRKIVSHSKKTQAMTTVHRPQDYYPQNYQPQVVVYKEKRRFIQHPIRLIIGLLIFCGIMSSIIQSEKNRDVTTSQNKSNGSTAVQVAPTATKEITYKKVSAYQLNNEYQENEIAADNKYKNKYVEVTGRVSSVDITLGTYYVSLDADGYGIYTVQCEFGRNQRNTLASLKAGQQVTIRGVCKGLFVVYVYVDNCQLVN